MEIKISQAKIESFVGNVLPLRLLGVEEYGMEAITWVTSNACVQITAFESFTDGVLLTLLSEGQSRVTAQYQGKEYVCTINIHKRMDVPSQKGLSYYIGDFHDHTAKTHNREEFRMRLERIPYDYLKQVEEEGILDFTVISDHADLLNEREFFRGFWDAFCLGEENLIVFPGSEAECSPRSQDRYGVIHKVGGEVVVVNADHFANTRTWDEFFGCYQTSPFAIGVLAHPQIIGISTKGVWNFNLDQNRTPEFHERIKAVEMGNGSDRESNLINEYTYSVALDNGFRVSTTCSSDCHGPIWGAKIFPGKTVIMAPEKSREAFLDAIEHRRFYASESGNVKVFYEVNGITAPCELPMTNEFRFHVELGLIREDAGGMPTVMQVISDYGKTVWQTENVEDRMDFTLNSGTARYFYLRLVDGEGKKTWSVPVWTGRTFDEPCLNEAAPIDKTGFTAVEEKTGADASVLLNDDPSQFFSTEGPDCSVLIDMKQTRIITALGHYPTMLDVKAIRAAGEKDKDWISQFPVRYQVETGITLDTMTVKAEGLFRVFGAEELIAFPPHEARFVRLRILSNAGKESGRPEYQNRRVTMAELTVYGE